MDTAVVWARTGKAAGVLVRPHGLGYTSWTYQQLDAPTAVGVEEGARVRVRVANVGNRPGKEVAQVYLSRPGSAIRRPPLWLAGFQGGNRQVFQDGQLACGWSRQAPARYKRSTSGWLRERSSIGRSRTMGGVPNQACSV